MHKRKIIIFLSVFCLILLGPLLARLQEASEVDPEEIKRQIEENDRQMAEKRAELERLNQELSALKQKRSQKESEAKTIREQIEGLELRIREAELELTRTRVSLENTQWDLQKTNIHIKNAEEKIAKHSASLINLLQALYELDEQSMVERIFHSGSLSEFLQREQYLMQIEDQTVTALGQLKDARLILEEEKKILEAKEQELDLLVKTQSTQKADLDFQQNKKIKLLKENLNAQAKVTAKMKEVEEARNEIQRQIFTLKNVGIRLSLKEAVDYAKYAGSLTGIRPALLLGVLKVESNLGSNVGTGTYKEDMHPGQQPVFEAICKELGLDPHKTPVSKKPTSYHGWGGAMGPGQIMPTTWQGIKGEVARLQGKTQASPWDLIDAFVGTAVILRNHGAASRDNEYEAVNRYFAGGNWQKYTWYGDRVLAVAEEYEKEM